jgi:hypothetical protein
MEDGMTASTRQVSELELDRLLGAWLAEGSVAAPDRVAERAIFEIATLRQERAPRFARRFAAGQHRLVWAALIALLVAILAGSIAMTGTLRVPTPPELPTRTVSSPMDGLTFEVPLDWQESATSEGARRYASPVASGPAVTVSYGISVFNSGLVTTCSTPVPDKLDCVNGLVDYQDVYDPAPSRALLVNELRSVNDRCGGSPCAMETSATTLDGEPADRLTLDVAGRRLTYISTMHDTRPVVLFWDEALADAEPGLVERMRASARFHPLGSGVDVPVVKTPPTNQPVPATTHYRDPNGRYELDVPSDWESSPFVIDQTNWFARYLLPVGQGVALTVSFGEANGSIDLCQPECTSRVIKDLDAFAEATVVVDQKNSDLDPEWQEDALLDGEPAQLKGFYSGRVANGSITNYAIYAIHDGRPVALVFRYWISTYRPNRPPLVGEVATDVQQVIDSFRFLETASENEVPSNEPKRYTDPDGRYALNVPRNWRASPVLVNGRQLATDFFTSSIAKPNLGEGYGGLMLTVSFGEADGSIDLCQVACSPVVAADLDALGEAVVVLPHPDPGNVVRESQKDTVLDGEPAREKDVETRPGQVLGPPAYYTVYAIHDGHPVALVFDHWRASLGTNRADIQAIIDSFRFLQ